MEQIHEDIQQVLFSPSQLKARVEELGAAITADYAGRAPLLVGILKGSFVFLSDLCRAIDLPCTVDFMAVSSYGNGSCSSGRVNITKDLSQNIAGKDVLIVEDILDSGHTLYELTRILRMRGPASLRICTLLDKPERREQDIQADYLGFSIPDAFVVGYGLDYAERYRTLPYVGILKPEIYSHP